MMCFIMCFSPTLTARWVWLNSWRNIFMPASWQALWQVQGNLWWIIQSPNPPESLVSMHYYSGPQKLWLRVAQRMQAGEEDRSLKAARRRCEQSWVMKGNWYSLLSLSILLCRGLHHIWRAFSHFKHPAETSQTSRMATSRFICFQMDS